MAEVHQDAVSPKIRQLCLQIDRHLIELDMADRHVETGITYSLSAIHGHGNPPLWMRLHEYNYCVHNNE